MAAVVSPSPHQRGHGGPPGRVRADQAEVPLDEHMSMLLEVHGWRRIRRFRTATAIGARYMGTPRADEFGKRNSVPGELVVRRRAVKVVVGFDLTG